MGGGGDFYAGFGIGATSSTKTSSEVHFRLFVNLAKIGGGQQSGGFFRHGWRPSRQLLQFLEYPTVLLSVALKARKGIPN
jgi:hypothetical protein